MKKKKKTNKTKPSSNPINGSDSSAFHLSIATTAVAQICHSLGFKSTQTTALQTLTNITVRYLTSLATSSATSAASSGRTDCNLYDVIRGMEDVHADVGFTGNSAVTGRLSSLSDSEMLKDMMRFVHWSPEIPFAKPLRTVTSSSYPMEKKKNAVPRGKQMVTSLCENEKLIHYVRKKSYCGDEKVFTQGEKEEKKEVPRGKRMLTSLYGENEGKSEGGVVPRGKQLVTCKKNEMCHVPKWLPEFPPNHGEKEGFTGEVNEKGKNSESENKKVNYYYNKEVSELPEVRKKVRFEIRGLKSSRREKDVIKVKCRGVDLRSGVRKGGKRILCQIYQDLDGKKYGDYDVVKKKIKFIK